MEPFCALNLHGDILVTPAASNAGDEMAEVEEMGWVWWWVEAAPCPTAAGCQLTRTMQPSHPEQSRALKGTGKCWADKHQPPLITHSPAVAFFSLLCLKDTCGKTQQKGFEWQVGEGKQLGKERAEGHRRPHFTAELPRVLLTGFIDQLNTLALQTTAGRDTAFGQGFNSGTLLAL